MTYTKLAIKPGRHRATKIFNLNQIDKGWVTQILNGSFGGTYEYGFKEYNLNSISRTSIDLNIRMTPVVPQPELNPRQILNFLQDVKGWCEFTLTDNYVPNFRLDYIKRSSDAPFVPRISSFEGSEWGSTGVVKEVKYNYSESPATIEFTLTSRIPVLYGPRLNFYFGIGGLDADGSKQQFKEALELLKSFNLRGTISKYGLCKKSNPKDSIAIVDFLDFPVTAVARTNGNSPDGEVWYNNGRFTFTGDFLNNMSYGYTSAKYSSMSIQDFENILMNSVGPRKIKDRIYGDIISYFELELIREGL
jgi:hypothetical protein|nr:MAG TPA: hypothetical protein [Caudoviricetes sp.]